MYVSQGTSELMTYVMMYVNNVSTYLAWLRVFQLKGEDGMGLVSSYLSEISFKNVSS